MASRKYTSEVGIHVLANCTLILQQTDFDTVESDELWRNHLDSYPAHIYTIVRRPRVLVKEASLAISDKFVHGEFTVRSAYGVESFPFQIRNGLGTSNVILSAPYPHQVLYVHDQNGEQISSGKASLLATENNIPMGTHLDFEVLYVGQSYGIGGSRTAMDRLPRHETLQNIYSRAAAETPDAEVWIMLWHLTPNTLFMFDGSSKEQTVTNEEDNQHLLNVLSSPPSDQQIVNLTEAAMIRHFQPEFNIRFKATFPSPAHETYSECYDLDLNTISIEVETEEVKTALWTMTVERSYRHFATFPLHSPEDRRCMFEMLLPDKSGWADFSKF